MLKRSNKWVLKDKRNEIMITAANQANENQIVISHESIDTTINRLQEEYAKECEYLYEQNLQYVDDEFDESEFLRLFFGQYPEIVDYWYSKLTGELELYNSLVIEYVQWVFQKDEDIVEVLEHLKKVLDCKESIQELNKVKGLMPKSKVAKYKPGFYVLPNVGVENRCYIGNLEKSCIDKVRKHEVSNIERVSFNDIFKEVLQEELGIDIKIDSKFVPLILTGYIKTEKVYDEILRYALDGKNYSKYIFSKTYDRISNYLEQLRKQGYRAYKLTNFYADIYKVD